MATWWKSRFSLAGSIFLVTFIAYIPALTSDFIWDDDSNVTQNQTLRTLDGLRRIWTDPSANQQYYPLTYTSFWLEYHAWGLKPFGYHLVNIGLHASDAVLLWFLLRSLAVPGAWLAAAIFALHPVQVETAAWITERKNTLSMAMFLASAQAYLMFAGLSGAGRREAGVRASRSSRGSWYAISILFFFGAVLAKSAACLLPAALVVVIWWKKDEFSYRDLLPLLPLFVIGGIAGLHTARLEKFHVGAIGTEFLHTPVEKILIAGRILLFYPAKLLVPANLVFLYPRWQISAVDLGGYLYPVAALAALLVLWLLRGRFGKGPLAAVLYYVVMIFPALGFFNVFFMRYSFVQDHFQYLASLGPISLFAATVTAGASTLTARLASRDHEGGGKVSSCFRIAVMPGIMVALLLVLGMLTWKQCHAYRDVETLWRHTLAKNPGSYIAHFNLAHVLVDRGRNDEAYQQYSEAIRLRPDSFRSYANRAGILTALGKNDLARADYLTALELARKQKDATAVAIIKRFLADLPSN